MISVNNVCDLDEKSEYRKTKKLLDKAKSLGHSKEDLIKLKQLRCKYDFLTFADLLTDGLLVVKPFHELIASTFEDLAYRRLNRVIISCPPRSGKSFLAALFIAWLVGLDGDANHILASYGQGLTNKLYKAAIGYIKHKEFGNIFPEWPGFVTGTKSEFKTKGYILNTSVSGVCTGFTSGSTTDYEEEDPGVGVFLIDDPLKSGYSKAALRELHEWWDTQADTRKTMSWAQMLIGTRFCKNDLHGFLLERDGRYHPTLNPLGWYWLNIQGLCENESIDPLGRKNGQSHWPDNEIFTEAMLNAQKAAMGANKFSAMYQGEPVAEEGSLFSKSLFKVVKKSDVVPRYVNYISADTAFGDNQETDPTVLTIFGISPDIDHDVHIIEQISGLWKFPELIQIVKKVAKYYDAKAIIVEEKSSGQPLLQVLEAATSLNTVGMKALKGKSTRLQQVLPLFDEGRVFFYEGTWNTKLLDELSDFPYSIHDDALDSLVYALLFFQLELDSNYNNYAGIIEKDNWLRNTVKRRFTNREGSDLLINRSNRVDLTEHRGLFRGI